jgi:hypothetical protein
LTQINFPAAADTSCRYEIGGRAPLSPGHVQSALSCRKAPVVPGCVGSWGSLKDDETKSTSAYSEIYRDLFRDTYVDMQYHFVQFFTEHLTDVSRVFGADLQSVLIIEVIGQNALSARIRGDGKEPVGINASSIADVTGIPRETVRRKLVPLTERGWIARESDGLWRLAANGFDPAPARRDLTDLNQRGIERISHFLGLMHARGLDAQFQRQAEQRTSQSSPLEPIRPSRPS